MMNGFHCFRNFIMILLIVSLLGCKSDSPEQKIVKVRCPDGRMVTDSNACTKSYEPAISHKEDDTVTIIPVNVSPVEPDMDPETVFNNYVLDNNFNYDFISSELFETRNGVDIYKVIYRHYKNGGGKMQIFVGSDGKIYEQKMMI